MSLEALWSAWLRCRASKRRRPSIAAFDLDADTHVLQLHRDLTAGSYEPAPCRLFVVHDPKLRLVAAPAIRDRLLHNALLSEIGPTYEHGFIDQSYACCTGRGAQRAVMEYLKHQRSHRYRLMQDVRRYFPSVNHQVLFGLFARRLRDARTSGLIWQLIQAGGEVYRSSLAREILRLDAEPIPPGSGLPLGGYFSHWSGALYLDGLDHFVKRQLKIKGYLRYMDDFALFSDSRQELEEARTAIAEWLPKNRKLQLKPRRDGIVPTSQPSTWLGCRISRAGVVPGPKAKRRMKRRLRDDGTLMTREQLQRTLQAYKGLFLSI